MDIKIIKTKITGSIDPHGFYTGYASIFGNVDLDGDVIQKGAFKKTIREKKGKVPIVWFHDPTEPIGLAHVEEDDRGLKVEGQLNLDVVRGRDAHSLMRQKVMIDHSFGFDTIKEGTEERNGREVRVIKETKLYEISPLPIGFGSNPEAGVAMVKRRGQIINVEVQGGIVTPEEFIKNFRPQLNTFLDQALSLGKKGVVPFQDHPLADTDRAWDAAAAQRRVVDWATDADGDIDWQRVHQAFTWFDADNPETLGAHKLPIADVIGGQLTVVPRAIFNAAARLNQTDVPASDLPGIRNHLRRYYAKMDLTPPWEQSSININDSEPGKSHSDDDGEPASSHSTEEIASVVMAIDNLTDNITKII